MPACPWARLPASDCPSPSTAGCSTSAMRAGTGGTLNILDASCRSPASLPCRATRASSTGASPLPRAWRMPSCAGNG
eukprot:6556273-Alexandrium_andersonii.AAC.1